MLSRKIFLAASMLLAVQSPTLSAFGWLSNISKAPQHLYKAMCTDVGTAVVTSLILLGLDNLANYFNLKATSAYQKAVRSHGLFYQPAQYLRVNQSEQNVLPDAIRQVLQALQTPIPQYNNDPGLFLIGDSTATTQTIRAFATQLGAPVIIENAAGLVGAIQGSGAASVTQLYQCAQANYDSRAFWAKVKNPFRWFTKMAPLPPTIIVLEHIEALLDKKKRNDRSLQNAPCDP